MAAIRGYVGGLRRARVLAGIPDPEPRSRIYDEWDAKSVLAEVRSRWRDREPLAASKVPPSLARAGRRLFGSWQNTIETAGLDYARIRLMRAAYTKEDIRQLLHRLARERPDMIWSQLHELSAATAMVRLFGSVPAAVEWAGFADWPVRAHISWTRDLVIRTLQARARTGIRLAVRGSLAGACTTYFGSVVAACHAAGVPTLRSRWSKERVVQELRRRAASSQPRDRNLESACFRYFGSVRSARRAAGVSPTPPTWSKEKVIQILRQRARNGELSIAGPLGDACSRLFGSRTAARRAAGIASPRTPMAEWSRDEILEELRRRVRAGESLQAIAKACRKHFRSLSAARQEAGLPVLKKSWTKASILQELRTHQGAVSRNASLAEACRQHFGSIERAYGAAGIRPAHQKIRWSQSLVRDQLRRWDDAGRGPMSTRLIYAARLHYDTVEAACAAVGLEPPVRHWTRERVIDALREAAPRGEKLSVALVLACRRQFGSIIAAREAAGVPTPRTRWTKERIVAELKARARRGLHGVDGSLQFACARHFGSVALAKRVAGVPASQRTWTRAAVLSELRRRWRNGQIRDLGLGAACRRYFGSVSKARRAAGLQQLQKAWTRRRVIDELRRHARDGTQLETALRGACKIHFGSMPAARRAAGLLRKQSVRHA